MTKVTKELQDTVKRNPSIQKVYFDDHGNHYFAVHEIEVHDVDSDGYSRKTTKVVALPGAKKNAVKIIIDAKRGKVIDKLVNTEYCAPHAEMTREQVLKANPIAKGSYTEEEAMDILLKASSIAKNNDFSHLLKQIK